MEDDVLWFGDDGRAGNLGSVPRPLVKVVVPADVVQHTVNVGFALDGNVVEFQFAVTLANDERVDGAIKFDAFLVERIAV